MEFSELLNTYLADPQVKSIPEQWHAGQDSCTRLCGLSGSMVSFLAAAVCKQQRINHLFIFPDKEQAAYFHNDLLALMPGKDVFFYPDSFKRPGHFDQISPTNILLRTESINRYVEGTTRSELMVTYPEAIFEKVVSRKVLKKNTLHLSIGEQVDMEFLIELFVAYDFERVDFVYEPGQFSIRGGLIDIFSYGHELPYRIELFADEVESIRTFDPATQLSKKKITHVTIIPNIQTHFSPDQKTHFFELVPKKTVIWLCNTPLIFEILQHLQQKAADMLALVNTDDLEEKHPFRFDGQNLPYSPAAGIQEEIMCKERIEFGDKFQYPPTITFDIKSSPQPAFNKNFELLISDLHKNQDEGYTNFIFAENPKQIERFYQIFEDLDAEIKFFPVYKALHAGFIDHDHKIACYTDHQIFNRYHKYHLKDTFSKSQALSLKMLRELKKGDFVTHIDHGIGVYSGLEKIEANGVMQEAVRLIYRDNDLLYVGINSLHKISKFTGKEGTVPRVNKLGTDAWEALKRKTKKKVKDIARDLILLYAKRKAKKGFAFAPDTYLQTELEASFIYEDTPDQEKATTDLKVDMESSSPMDRLICGDVGFGKTEIAIRAAFKAITDSKQVAVLVPTTILAMQHFRTFSDRLRSFPCTIDFISRFKSTAQKKDTIQKLKEGKIDLVIGTHSLIGKQVQFKDLGLIIVDEEQKFGVAAKEKLKSLKLNVDTLTLTATPIPRTLQFSLMGARDLSIINTPPPNRQPINTELHVFNDDLVREAVYYEYYRGGQVFFIHNRVKDIVDIATMLSRLCPDVSIGIAHGQMEGARLETEMLKFIDQEYDVLVSTNIIEAGLDIPNANTIIINNAQSFGLSDLHQLRGRVGRSNKKAFCYLFTPPLSSLTSDARKRLSTIEQFSELGSGFQISMRDLDIRGAGNLLGAEQSGFIAEIGYELYHKILDEAIQELKEVEYKDLFAHQLHKGDYVRECQLDLDIEMLIPDDYVRNITERMNIYTELNNIQTEARLQQFQQELADRFGPIPKQLDTLFEAIRIQWKARKAGFERLVLRNKTLKGFFPSNQESPFYNSDLFSGILSYIQQNPANMRLKQTEKHLVLFVKNITGPAKLKAVIDELASMKTDRKP